MSLVRGFALNLPTDNNTCYRSEYHNKAAV
jgi:hypothetical protein